MTQMGTSPVFHAHDQLFDESGDAGNVANDLIPILVAFHFQEERTVALPGMQQHIL